MGDKLSPEMQHAINKAKAKGGKLLRSPGGFWGRDENGWFATTTIEALVRRGIAEYTDWQERKNSGGRFPIEVTVK